MPTTALALLVDGEPTASPRRALVRPAPANWTLRTRLATGTRDLDAALQLRHDVFRVELGADLATASGLDEDVHDVACDHLLVEYAGTPIATCRLQPAETAAIFRGFAAARIFDPGHFATIADDAVEIGRACAARGHRDAAVLDALWRGVTAYARAAGKRWLFGACPYRRLDETAREAPPATSPLATQLALFRRCERVHFGPRAADPATGTACVLAVAELDA